MSLDDLIALASRHPLAVLAVLGPLPVLAWLVGRLAGGRGDRAPWRVLYAVLVYLACVPGIFACVLTGYRLFFLRSNLLRVDAPIHLLPIVVMVLTLVVIRRDVEFDRIPGFDRIGGLMLVIGVSFAVALLVVNLRVWVLFGSSIATLGILALFAFALLTWGWRRLFR